MIGRGWQPGPLSPAEPEEPDILDRFETETDLDTPTAPRPDDSWWRGPAPDRTGTVGHDDGPPTLAPGFGTASPAYGRTAGPEAAALPTPRQTPVTASRTSAPEPDPELEPTEPQSGPSPWSADSLPVLDPTGSGAGSPSSPSTRHLPRQGSGPAGQTRPSARRLLSATAIMAAGTMASRLLGLVRVVLAAWLLGNNSRQADIFSVATTVPTSLYFLFAGGVLNTVLVPQLVRAVKNDPDGGEAYTNRIMTAFLMLVGAITLILVLAAPLVTWFYSDAAWHTDELAAHFDSMVLLTALCLPQVFFYGAFFLGGQVLNARDAFGPMMWAPIANNVIQVLVLATYAAVWGSRTDTSAPFSTAQALVLGLGSVVGIAAQVGVLVPFLRRVGFRYRPRFDLRHTGLGRTFHLAKWTLGFVALNQVALMIVTKLATSATAGGTGAGTTTYNYANLLWVLPHSLITVGLATAMLPSLSRMAAESQEEAVRTELTSAIRMASTALVPVALLYLSIGVPIAEMAFRGPSKGGDLIGWTLVMFAGGLVPFSLQYLILRGYYAYEDTRSTFFLQVLITALNASLALVLVKLVAPGPNWVAPMLALSYTLAYIVGLVVSLLHFRGLVPSLDLAGIGRHLARVSLAALPGTVVGAGLVWWQASTWDGLVIDVVGLGVGVAVAVGSYPILARRMGLSEVDEVVAIVLRRLGRGRPRLDADPVDKTDASTTAVVSGPGSSAEAAAAGSVSESESAVSQPSAPPEPAGTPVWEGSADQTVVREAVTVVRPAIPPVPVPPPDPDDVPPADLSVGDLIGNRYRLDELIVLRGSTGTWKAYDRVLSRSTLVHVLSPDSPRTPQILEAARSAARATDSRFLRVLDAVDDATGCYIVCEWAEGALLETLLTAGPLTAVESAWVVRELADALASMHATGLYHQRLHPESVVISATGNIKIIGFLIDAALYRSVSGMPAEQEAIDLEALGKILYACLTSRWPGGGFGLPAAPRDSRGQLLAPARVRTGVSPILDRITSDILAPSATGLRSSGAVAKDLSLVLGGADASTDLANRVRMTTSEVPYGLGRGGHAPAPGTPEPTTQPAPAPAPIATPSPTEPTLASGVEPTKVTPIRRQPSRLAWWMLPAAVVLAVAVVAGTWVATRSGKPGGTTMLPVASATPTRSGPYPIRTARDFDPEADGGNGEENPNLVAQAYDGRPETAWRTLSYRGNAKLGGLKPGVGLVVDLGHEVPVASVKLTLVGRPTSVEWRVPNTSGVGEPAMDSQKSWRTVSRTEATETSVDLSAPEPVVTRFLLIYLTSLPPVGSNYQGAIAEVQVMP